MKPQSTRGMAANEVFFRQRNEEIQKGLDRLDKLADEVGENHPNYDTSAALYFYCECSDENCHKRISMSLPDYNKIHKDEKAFIVIPGHETNKIERIVRKTTKYNVVQKHVQPPKRVEKLQRTEVNNV